MMMRLLAIYICSQAILAGGWQAAHQRQGQSTGTEKIGTGGLQSSGGTNGLGGTARGDE